eukprot:5540423-Pyramimonas_sp.AAC.1
MFYSHPTYARMGTGTDSGSVIRRVLHLDRCPTGYASVFPCPTGYASVLPCPTGYASVLPCPTGYASVFPCPTGYASVFPCPTGYASVLPQAGQHTFTVTFAPFSLLI